MLRLSFVLCVLGAFASRAEAGRRNFAWQYPSEVLTERGAEIETSIYEENRDENNERQTLFVWGATVGVTDQLELAFPAEWRWSRTDEKPGAFTFTRFGAEARYRLVSGDPVERPALQPLLRLAVKRDIGQRETVRGEADLIVAYTAGKLLLATDIGFTGDVRSEDPHFEIRPAVGLAYEVYRDVRLGVEGYGELGFDHTERSWYAVGPGIAWTHGRFWLNATYAVGVYQIGSAPRVTWGIAF